MAGLRTAFAGIRAAYAGLREADAAVRSRDRPGGALMGLSAYLVGFAVIRTAANSYIYFSSLRRLVPREDAYALAVIGAAIACAPLAAALCLARGRSNADRRLSLVPMKRTARLAVAALGPAITALPAILLASALPAIAALPMAAWSPADYLVTAAWFPATAAALSLGVRSLVGAAAGALRTGGAIRRGRGHGRVVALAGALLACAAANPSPSVEGGRAALSVFGGKRLVAATLMDAEAVVPLPFPTGNGVLALVSLVAAVSFAGLAAVAEDASQSGSMTAGSGERPPRRRFGLYAAWPMAAVADRKRDAALSLAASLAFAVAAVAQGASPHIPLAAAAAVLAVRIGSSFAFIATDSTTTRRFSLIPARSGSVDRAYLVAALSLAAIIASPLAAAAIARALNASG